jgi:hypothetical protein
MQTKTHTFEKHKLSQPRALISGNGHKWHLSQMRQSLRKGKQLPFNMSLRWLWVIWNSFSPLWVWLCVCVCVCDANAYSFSYLDNCRVRFGNTFAFILLWSHDKARQDNKHGFIKHSNEKHSTILMNRSIN